MCCRYLKLTALLFFFVASSVMLMAQESASDSSSHARYGVHVNLSMIHSKFGYLGNEPGPGLKAIQINNNIAFGIGAVLRKLTPGGNAWEFALGSLYYIRDNNSTFQVYDTGSGTLTTIKERSLDLGIGANFEFDFILFKKKEGLFKPFVGISSTLFYKFHKSEPVTTGYFTTSSWSVGEVAWFVPGLLANIKDSYYFKISFPIDIGTFAFKSVYADNPLLPESVRKVQVWDYDYQFNFRVEMAFGIYLRKASREK